jgi:hypothetical protein
MLGRLGVRGVDVRASRHEAPGLKDRETVADVAKRDHEVVALAVALDRGRATLDAHHPPLSEADRLGRIIRARGSEHRSHAEQERPLGNGRRTLRNARRALPEPHRGERRDRQYQRSHGRRQRGNRRPVESHGDRHE